LHRNLQEKPAIPSLLRSYSLALLLAIPASCWSQSSISPGLWKIISQVQTDAGSMPTVHVSQCLTAADVNDPSKLLVGIANPGASGCTYLNKRYSENIFHFAMECAGTLAIKATGQVSMTSNTMSGTINTSATINGQPVNLKGWVVATRVGDC
jgi:hypothetical protein